MTPAELRDLDAWIAENVMGWRVHCRNTAIYVPKEREHSILDPWSHDYRDVAMWRPTEDKSAAMDVLERCLAKMHERRRALEMMKWDNETITLYSSDELQSGNNSLPLAICLFAKALFGKADELREGGR